MRADRAIQHSLAELRVQPGLVPGAFLVSTPDTNPFSAVSGVAVHTYRTGVMVCEDCPRRRAGCIHIAAVEAYMRRAA